MLPEIHRRLGIFSTTAMSDGRIVPMRELLLVKNRSVLLRFEKHEIL
jgi:hypothetical protein